MRRFTGSLTRGRRCDLSHAGTSDYSLSLDRSKRSAVTWEDLVNYRALWSIYLDFGNRDERGGPLGRC